MGLTSPQSPSRSEDSTDTIPGRREQLREQHELTQEIGNAITSMPITEPIDEDELEADLAALEQENLDEKMLKTGTMPVADSLNRLPKVANGARKFAISLADSFFQGMRNVYLVLELTRILLYKVPGTSKKPPAEEEDEEEELRKLQAEMAM